MEEKRSAIKQRIEESGGGGRIAEFRRKIDSLLESRKDLEEVFRKGREKARERKVTVRTQFMDRKEVYGVGEGDEELVVLLDKDKKETDIPTEIDGIPVKIERTSRLVYMPDLQPQLGENKGRKERWRPIPGGVAAGHYKLGGYGTMGCVVYKGGKKYALSNNHVFARTNNAKIGDNVSQPGGAKHVFGKLAAFIPIKNGVKVDCAIARPENDDDIIHLILKSDTEYEPYIYSKGVMGPTVGRSVMKSGARTGYSEGTIKTIKTTMDVGYGGAGVFRIEDCIYTSVIGWPGDSGSLVLDKSTSKAVGLLFCGSASGNGHCDISNVLGQLGCDMPTEVGKVPRIGYIDVFGSPDKGEIYIKKIG